MIKEQHIKKIVEEKLSGTELFLVDVKIKSGNQIHVFIDSDTSVNINDCASLSKFIETKLDRDIEDFELKVSSSGLDHPLLLFF